MFTIVLIVFLAGLLLAISVRLQGDTVDHRLTVLLLSSYALRLLVAPLTHTAHVFSTPSGVDSAGYEGLGETIARLWRYTGVHYVTGDEIPGLEQVSLPPNIFAAVDYLNGGATHLGCVAVVAVTACFVCLDLYLVCLVIGARRDVALAITALISILPSFFYYTSDTYKDGFVAFLALGILGCSVRLAHKFSFALLAWAGVLLLGLWVTRFYLVFVMPAPLLLGVLGLRSGSVLRATLAVLVIAGGIAGAYAYSDVPAVATEHAMRTFQSATSQDVLNANADSASGVNLGTGPGSFFPKLAYTLFSPFPWQSGSMGLQIEKLEAFIWYYFFYRAVRAARTQWKETRSNLLLFVSFLVPVTVAYAFSFSNIGLIVRQRIDIVLATIVLASVSWSVPRTIAAQASPRGGPAPATAPAGRAQTANGRAPRHQW